MTAFTISTKDLMAAVKRLKPAFQRYAEIPILSHTLASVSDGLASFVQTNLDLEIHHTAKVTADAEFAFTVDYKLMARLAALDCDSLTFAVAPGKDAEKLTVSADGFSLSANLLCQVVDFPLMQADRLAAFDAAKSSAEIDCADLNRLLRLSAHCLPTEEASYYLQGVYLCNSPSGTLRAVATNGHRLARIDSTVAWNGPEVILPTRAVKALMAEKTGSATLSLCADPLLAVVEGDGWTYRAKLIDGKYPNYAKSIPDEDSAIEAVISADQIKRLMVVSQDWKTAAPVKLSAGMMSVASVATGTVSVPAQIKCPDGHAIGFNRQYLADQARVTPTFKISARGPMEPARIVGEDPLALFILMPMRID